MKIQLTIIAAVLVALTSVGRGETPEELAQFVVKQSEEAREGFRSVHYHFVQKYRQLAPGPKDIRATFEGEWKQAGEQRWKHVRRHSQYSDDPMDVQDDVSTLYVGLAASGKYVEGTSNPNECEHEDILKPNQSEKMLIRLHFSEDPFLYAFGIHGTPLHEYFLKRETVPVRWEAQAPQAEADGCFTLTRLLRDRPQVVCKIDPKRGWLITSLDVRESGGKSMLEVVTVPAQEAVTKLWYPSKVQITRYRPGRDGIVIPQSTTELTVSDLHANVDFPAQQFTTASLGLPVGVELIRQTSDGKLAVFEQRENGLVMIRKPAPPGRRE